MSLNDLSSGALKEGEEGGQATRSYRLHGREVTAEIAFSIPCPTTAGALPCLHQDSPRVGRRLEPEDGHHIRLKGIDEAVGNAG